MPAHPPPGPARRVPRGPTGEMPFLDHLEELRWRVLWSLAALVVATGIGFALVHYFGLELLIRPVRPFLAGDQLVFFNPATPFFITLKLGLLVGILLAFPIVLYQVWAFFSPALEPREKKIIVPSLYFGLALFTAGVAMAYFWVLPLALRFLMGFQQAFLEPAIEVGEYLGFVVRLLLAFGLVFELPVVIMILSALGLVTPRFLREKRRHAIFLIVVLASLLTPGDIASTFLMIAPMIVLYEVSIVISSVIQRRREEPLRPSSEPPPGTVEAGP
ncbi:MAG: twin-arginine translocase subunit TatC [Gemmatimonadales bacterium]|nr:MAG: twin-arginine translocase subunit TatC [Gemmatimonadales bacterium]